MIAFHGKADVKKKYLDRVTMHERADEIVKGAYWGKGKGCAIGCTIHGSDHSAYERELGIPRIIARLEDSIFEGLPNALAKTWPRLFLEAISPGADMSLVWPKFAVWMLVDEKYGVIQFAKTQRIRESIQSVADLYAKCAAGEHIDQKDWSAVRAAAAYAADAAYAAAYAADASAAYAAAAADAYAAAADAAYAAAAVYSCADDAAAAREHWRIAQSNKLIELLRAAK